jgi:hypothetical protein
MSVHYNLEPLHLQGYQFYKRARDNYAPPDYCTYRAPLTALSPCNTDMHIQPQYTVFIKQEKHQKWRAIHKITRSPTPNKLSSLHTSIQITRNGTLVIYLKSPIIHRHHITETDVIHETARDLNSAHMTSEF